MQSIQGLRAGLAQYLSPDEMTARSKRLYPDMRVDRYTGTLNNPIEEAQSRYAGPEWGQFFGALQKQQEDAQNAGMRFGINFRGFGRPAGS